MNLTLLLLSPLVIASSTKFESVRNFSRSIIITCIVLIDDTMKRSEEFMTKAYKQSFIYFCRYLQSKETYYQKIFKKINDSKLSAISRETKIHKAKKRDTLYLTNGGFLVKGDLYIDQIHAGSLMRDRHHNLSLILPTQNICTCVTECIILEFSHPIFILNDSGGVEFVFGKYMQENSVLGVSRRKKTLGRKSIIQSNSKNPLTNLQKDKNVSFNFLEILVSLTLLRLRICLKRPWKRNQMIPLLSIKLLLNNLKILKFRLLPKVSKNSCLV